MKIRRLLFAIRFVIFAGLLALLLGAGWVAGRVESAPAAFHPGRVLVKLKPDAQPQAAGALHHSRQHRVRRSFPDLGRWVVVELPAGEPVADAIRYYLESGLAEAAEPDYLLHTHLLPNDPSFLNGTQWALRNTGSSGGTAGADIGAVEAWDTIHAADDMIVAIVDSGARLTHLDLVENLWINPGEIPGNGIDDDRNGFVDDIHGINAIHNTGNPADDAGHGTHVAGIIGAVGNNGRGVTGVAWRVRLMICKFSDASGAGATSDAIQCIDYARQKGAHIINASWGSTGNSLLLRAAIDRARQSGIIFVAAAGNESSNTDVSPNYPSSFPLDNIVSVAATTRADALADYSNFGAISVDLGAPGSAIYSTWFSADHAYEHLSGTSMATPFVAGAFALLRARFPGEAHPALIARLLAAADPLPSLAGRCVTGGRLNLARALGPSVLAAFGVSANSGSPPVTITFTDKSLGPITTRAWNFGDGSPARGELNPTHTFTQEGQFTVTLTVTGGDGRESAAQQKITVVANYALEPAPFEWIDPAAMTRVTMPVTGVSGALALPFPFVFYGQSYNTVFLAADGMLGFSPAGLTLSENTNLPNPSTPNAVLYPYWDNLRATVGEFRFGTVGAAPHRSAVASWVNVQRQGGGQTPTLTFQVILEEGTDRIRFQYLNVDPSRSSGAGRSATIGLENETGTVAAKYSFNGEQLLNDAQAILFTPRSGGGLAVTPATAFRAQGNAGGPFLPASGSYKIRNTGSGDLQWRLNLSRPWLTASTTQGALPPGGETSVMLSINSAAFDLPAGTYAETVEFLNMGNGIGNTTREAGLIVNGTTGILSISPLAGLSASGAEGGPFTGAARIYTLINTGDAALDWAASQDVPWAESIPAEGTLGPGETVTVRLMLSTGALGLTAGVYQGNAVFWNITNARGDTTRPLRLTINPPATSLTLAASLVGSGLRLQLTGLPASDYTLQTSDDLFSWEDTESMTTGSDGTASVLVTPPLADGARYFRARSRPADR